MDLAQFFVTSQGKNIIKNAHYFRIYERHFGRFVDNSITMFEIGTGEGGSAKMWKTYFGPKSRIITIDIADKASLAEEQIIVRTGSQADPAFLRSLVEEFGPPDIVLDDGSHMMEHINTSFETLFPLMDSDGVYLVEDLDGAYWPERGGGLGSENSFIERCKILIDDMNAGFTRGSVQPKSGFEHIVNISFYQMIVVIERAKFYNLKMLRRPVPLDAEIQSVPR